MDNNTSLFIGIKNKKVENKKLMNKNRFTLLVNFRFPFSNNKEVWIINSKDTNNILIGLLINKQKTYTEKLNKK